MDLNFYKPNEKRTICFSNIGLNFLVFACQNQSDKHFGQFLFSYREMSQSVYFRILLIRLC
jgi:hypothetical protein